jgi:hypothetical protein
VQLSEPRPPLQGTSGEFSSVVDVVHHYFGCLFWISPTHMCLQYEFDQKETITNVRSSINPKEQFNSLGVSLNVLGKSLKKSCAEIEEAILNGLISRANNPEVPRLDDSITCCQQQYNFTLSQWKIAWQQKVEGECFDIGFHLCHGKIFEVCPSVYMAMVMFYGNYHNLNSSAWYTTLNCSTPSVVHICTLMYGIQRQTWGILSGAFLKHNHHTCCSYALKPWSPLDMQECRC